MGAIIADSLLVHEFLVQAGRAKGVDCSVMLQTLRVRLGLRLTLRSSGWPAAACLVHQAIISIGNSMIARPVFSLLKLNYRTQPSQIHTCSMHFPNTCAIRMSEALVRTNAQFLTAFKNSGKNICPHGYIRGAQDLAAVLNSPGVFGTRTYGWNAQPGGNAPANVKGIKGIICYMSIPSFSGQGHIDLWDGNGPVGNAYWDAKTIWMWSLI